MIRKIVRQAIPQWGGWPKSYRIDEWRRDFERRFDTWRSNLDRYLTQQLGDVVDQVNTQVQGRGPDIVSENTIIVTHPIHRVSGSASISNIVPPDAQRRVESDHTTLTMVSAFTGALYLIPAAGSTWTLDTAGNIYKTATAVVGQALIIVFDGEKWAPAS